MKIKYLGPRDVIRVGGFGDHRRDEVKEYPEAVGRELVATGVRQKFETVENDDLRDLFELIAAAKMAIDEGKVITSGKPDIKYMSEIVGREVTAGERDLAWAELQKTAGGE